MFSELTELGQLSCLHRGTSLSSTFSFLPTTSFSQDADTQLRNFARSSYSCARRGQCLKLFQTFYEQQKRTETHLRNSYSAKFSSSSAQANPVVCSFSWHPASPKRKSAQLIIISKMDSQGWTVEMELRELRGEYQNHKPLTHENLSDIVTNSRKPDPHQKR